MSIDSSLKWLLWPGRKIFGLANLRDRKYDKFHLNYGNEEEGCSLERNYWWWEGGMLIIRFSLAGP